MWPAWQNGYHGRFKGSMKVNQTGTGLHTVCWATWATVGHRVFKIRLRVNERTSSDSSNSVWTIISVGPKSSSFYLSYPFLSSYIFTFFLNAPYLSTLLLALIPTHSFALFACPLQNTHQSHHTVLTLGWGRRSISDFHSYHIIMQFSPRFTTG